MNASYLRYKKGVYHVRIRVPQDLKHLLPRTEIIKSLKTSDKTIAKLLAKDYIFKMNRKFVLLRSGYLDDHQKQQMVSTVVKPEDISKTTTFTLSMLIDDYVLANQQKCPPGRVWAPNQYPVPCCHAVLRQEVCHLQGKLVEFPIGNHLTSHVGAVHEGGFVAQRFKCIEKIDQCLNEYSVDHAWVSRNFHGDSL